MPELQSLVSLSQALISDGYEDPGFQVLFEAAQAGWIPVEEGDNGQWFFDLAHLRVIAEVLIL